MTVSRRTLARLATTLAATAALRVLIQKTPLRRWVRHEALFDCALFILMLSGITWAATT